MTKKCKLDSIENNNNEERSILKELLEKPSVDSQLLKHIFQFISKEQNSETFLKTWKRVYYTTKKPLFDKMVDDFYDAVDGETFEKFINGQKDNYSDARAELAKIIDLHRIKYTESNHLDTSYLKKMLFLLIAADFMPLNFFLVFNYACSKECDRTGFKTTMLDSIYDLQMVGYNPQLDQVFYSL